MVIVTVTADCGNSPKNHFIKDFLVAFAHEDNPKIVEMVSDDVVWDVVGHSTITGKEAFQKALDGIPSGQVKEFILDNVLTHGKLGAASGQIIFKNDAVYAFSDVYEFSSASGKEIKLIRSFNIEVKN